MGIVWIIRNYLFKPKKTAEMIYPSDINIVGSRKFLMFIFFFAGAFIILKQTGFSVYSLVSALILLFIVMTGTNLFIKGVAGVYRIIYKKAAKREIEKVEIEILLLPVMQIFACTALLYAVLHLYFLDYIRIILRIIIFSQVNYVVYNIIKARFGIVVEKAGYLKTVIILIVLFTTIADYMLIVFSYALK
jgi:hypothetical protein